MMSLRSESRTEQYFVAASSIARNALSFSIPLPAMWKFSAMFLYRLGTVDSLAHDVDRECFDWRPLLRHDVDDIIRHARRQRAKERLRRALSSFPITIEMHCGPVWTSGVELVLPNPLHVNQRRLRRGFCRRRHGRCHRSAPFSIGTRTALPHSVQLPS